MKTFLTLMLSATILMGAQSARARIVSSTQRALEYLDSSISNELTQEELDFINDMKRAKTILSQLDSLKNKKGQLKYQKKELEKYITQLKNENVQNDRLTMAKQKSELILTMESMCNEAMSIFENLYEMSIRVEKLSYSLNAENISTIKKIKKSYDSLNYPQHLLRVYKLDQIISIQAQKSVNTAINTGIVEQFLGIKVAYAATDPTGIGGKIPGFVCPPIGIYDAGVGITGTVLDGAIWLGTLGNVNTDICRDTASWLQVGSDVNRVINACGLSEANHVDETVLNYLSELITGETCSKCNKVCKGVELYNSEKDVSDYSISDYSIANTSSEKCSKCICDEMKGNWNETHEKCCSNGYHWIPWDKD